MLYIPMLRCDPDLCVFILVKFVLAVMFRKSGQSLCDVNCFLLTEYGGNIICNNTMSLNIFHY